MRLEFQRIGNGKNIKQNKERFNFFKTDLIHKKKPLCRENFKITLLLEHKEITSKGAIPSVLQTFYGSFRYPSHVSHDKGLIIVFHKLQFFTF